MQVADVVDSKPKRCKGENDESVKAKAERSCSENSGDSGSPRALKDSNNRNKILSKQDYIHVRARRGQATDSHSLAERVKSQIPSFLLDSIRFITSTISILNSSHISVALPDVSHHVVRSSGSQGEDQRADEVSSGPSSWLQ